ncbi:unnamed protein product [Rotaria magnacalcarata]|uniref:AH domain-containing protein n=3 Tax=Rotaria magnacalcarata TaxID=392030 RepID=A0A816ME89_9BILA|nr:unnamed protein product [Rotaria magnacalcarata]CAF3749126.1 unnamed protein product [Rotaria magnacalcarata]
MSSKNFYDKHAEHQDNTSLGKLRSTYWTTKQLVMKKLGREEDEFVIASDADVDAKLELLYAIRQSCHDLLRIMENYQTNLLILAHEETDMARFLKDYAHMDKTRAGKMMASVSKVLAYTAHQRLALRPPLIRLNNEIETFRHRAVTDTLSTVKRMETARTEYRGSILWLKDASTQLDPEKQLEKFRRVQSQVKQTKGEYDRLKNDVIEKIDLLTASRCNMYSYALATYQKSLLVFWEKTSKTMKAVAESFKGYQYYEFTVIKNLTEPSRLLAEMNSNSSTDKSKVKDDELIDINETKNNRSQDQIISIDNNQKETSDPTEPINALIDISDDQLDSQLLELEKLTTIDRNPSASINKKKTSGDGENLVELSTTSTEQDKLFSDFLLPILSGNTTTDLLDSNENNSFDAQWTSAFDNISSQQPAPNIQKDSTASNNNSFLPSTLLSELLTSMNKSNKSTVQPTSNPKPKSVPAAAAGKTTEKSSWLNLFAELDPLQNPDAVGKAAGDEADRNC